MRNAGAGLWEAAKILIIAVLVVAPIRAFIFQPFLVQGASMEPTYTSGSYLIVDEVSYRFEEPQRGDVVVFKFPADESQRFIKRIVGLPGETVEVEDGKVVVYRPGTDKQEAFVLQEPYLAESLTPGSTRLKLGSSEYFVMGDNRSFSSDSRSWGAVSKNEIIGRVFVRLFPLVSAFAQE